MATVATAGLGAVCGGLQRTFHALSTPRGGFHGEHAQDTGRGYAHYLFLISFIAALGGFLFGFDTAVVSGTLVQLTAHFSSRH